jgi:5-methyltetrahydrofolate--homocysteine methyltransferase
MFQAMDELVAKISACIERGKVNQASPYPKDMKGEAGADEFVRQALAAGAGPEVILQACSDGMQRIGAKFGRGEAFVPELLMAAKAMNAAMAHLKPFFLAGTVKPKGCFVLGTVSGDLHDIGKNLVSMVVAGNGWEVVDLGVDVKTAKFFDAIRSHPGCIVGLSALLTTTMGNMAATVKEIKAQFPKTVVLVGGAPLTAEAATRMGADGYAPDPQRAAALLNQLAAAA